MGKTVKRGKRTYMKGMTEFQIDEAVKKYIAAQSEAARKYRQSLFALRGT